MFSEDLRIRKRPNQNFRWTLMTPAFFAWRTEPNQKSRVRVVRIDLASNLYKKGAVFLMETVIYLSTWLSRAGNFGGTSRKARHKFGMILTEPNLAKTAGPWTWQNRNFDRFLLTMYCYLNRLETCHETWLLIIKISFIFTIH